MIKKFNELVKGDIHKNVIVCGDPGRVMNIAKYLDNPEVVADSREYKVMNGQYKGIDVTIASHGVGASGAACCFERLITCGAEKLIRVGTAGSYREEHPAGSLIITDSAVREEGVTYQLVPKGMPAVADFRMVQELEVAAIDRKVQFDIGTIVTLDVFYEGIVKFPHHDYRDSGALGAEMEMSALFIIAKMRGARAAGIVSIDGYADSDLTQYNPNKQHIYDAIDNSSLIALDAIVMEDINA